MELPWSANVFGHLREEFCIAIFFFLIELEEEGVSIAERKISVGKVDWRAS